MFNSITFALVLHVAMTVSCLWGVLCRLNLMGKGTKHYVFVEYFLMGVILLCCLALPSSYLLLASLAVLLLWFVVTSAHWRNGQPQDTLQQAQHTLKT
jgi:hypothetical protein